VLPARLAAARVAALAPPDDAGGSGRPEDGAPARLARALRVGAVLTGVVAPVPRGVAVRVALVDARGAELARAEAHGPGDDLPGIIDRISLDILRGVWGRRWGVPLPDLAAVSTASPAALYAYMRGEAFIRAARWDSAAAALARAVDADSTFALAQLRLAEAYGWRGEPGSAPALRALASASRVAARLPRRDRALLGLRLLHESGDLAALDSAHALVRRYPDDPEARYVLADVAFHARAVFGADFTRATVALFDSAVALDPQAGRVHAHRLTLALELGDSLRFAQSLASRAADPAVNAGFGRPSPGPSREYALLAALRWGTPPAGARRLVAGLNDSVPAVHGEVLWHAFSRAALLGPAPRPDLAARGLSQLRATYRRLDEARVLTERAVAFQLGTGQVAAVGPDLARLWVEDAVAPPALLLLPVTLGYAGPDLLAGVEARMATEPAWRELPVRRRTAAYWYGVFALARGDVARARALLRRAVAPGAQGDSVPRALAGAVQAAEGWASLAGGDTANAVRLMEAGVRTVGYDDEAVRRLVRPTVAVLARVLARLPDRRADAIDRMRLLVGGAQDGPVWAWWWRELAAALEADGDARGAAAARARFAALWMGPERP
jgi:tetratricopeptide (TPR) repeat protein